MIITLQKFNDLGKCSMGTCLEHFNTDTDRVYVKDGETNREVKITSINDLFPYLWCVAYISTGSHDEHSWFFIDDKTWWQVYYEDSIEFHKNLIKKFDKKLAKKYTSDVEDDKNDSLESIEHCKERIEELNHLMKDNEELLITENSVL